MNKTKQPPEEDVEQKQLPIPTEKTPIVDLPSSPSKAVKRGKPAKKKAKAAMVHLASSPSKVVKRGRLAKNEGEAAMVDLASSPSKGAMVDLVSSPSKGVPFEWVDAHFLYQPTADDEGVLADLRRKCSLATKRGLIGMRLQSRPETYEIMGSRGIILVRRSRSGRQFWVDIHRGVRREFWALGRQNMAPRTQEGYTKSSSLCVSTNIYQ
uniref:Uncharacterized protein n=1 Tax=Fagus sylvatica TaxID=28930 RepID=A0A2N9EMM0_FAGSY